MRVRQLERGRVVIEVSRLPAFGRMARRTIWSKRAAMRVIFGMTRETILRRSSKIGQYTRIGVTILAHNLRVFADEFEVEPSMREVFVEAIDAIVAT